MRLVLFYHSLRSDWNHGNAHFLRGVVTELRSRGHEVAVYEPEQAWSLVNLLEEPGGPASLEKFRRVYPGLESHAYRLAELDLDRVLEGADLVIIHEWSDHELVARVGRHRAGHNGYRLLFHDTHHRSLTERQSIAAYDLSHYDGVLAFGEVIRDLYLAKGWIQRAWTWHEAADTRVFRPLDGHTRDWGDLVWVGNWGDEERTSELFEFVFDPILELKLKGRVYGVRYPREAREALEYRGIEYAGWLPNFEVPEVFSRFRCTVHVPRRPYVEALPGIPTIRPFEALACGIPLICAPWEDIEGLFRPGRDYLIARNGREVKRQIRDLLNDPEMAAELALSGHETILKRHTCAHRVDELLAICRQLGLPSVYHN